MEDVKIIGSEGDAQAPEPRSAREARALLRLPLELRRREADLFSTKWFDYRLLDPVQATHLYVGCYNQAIKDFCAMTHDVDRVETMRLITDLWNTRETVSIFTARQHLDAIGCRYDWAMSFLVNRFSDRGWHGIPRPNQLYGQELMMDINDAWNIECSASLQLPKSPALRLDPDSTPTTVQAEFEQWVIGQVHQRGPDHWRIVARLLKDRFLTPGAALRAFGEATLQRAQQRLAGS